MIVLAVIPGSNADAQRRQRISPIPVPVPQRIEPSTPPVEGSAAGEMPRETVQADVSTHNVPVTSNFAGTEIVVFGAVDYSRQSSAEAGLYDVVIVVVGTPTRLTVRKKGKVAGIWLNTDAISFESVPSYYAIASTRPLDEVASPEVLKATGIGFEYVPMELAKSAEKRTAAEVRAFRQAIVGLKNKDRLYTINEYAVAFIGRSLFRASIDVPANVVVGPFETRVYLFRNGELLSKYDAQTRAASAGIRGADVWPRLQAATDLRAEHHHHCDECGPSSGSRIQRRWAIARCLLQGLLPFATGAENCSGLSCRLVSRAR